jgi:hypothetical protein
MRRSVPVYRYGTYIVIDVFHSGNTVPGSTGTYRYVFNIFISATNSGTDYVSLHWRQKWFLFLCFVCQKQKSPSRYEVWRNTIRTALISLQQSVLEKRHKKQN